MQNVQTNNQIKTKKKPENINCLKISKTLPECFKICLCLKTDINIL